MLSAPSIGSFYLESVHSTPYWAFLGPLLSVAYRVESDCDTCGYLSETSASTMAALTARKTTFRVRNGYFCPQPKPKVLVDCEIVVISGKDGRVAWVLYYRL